MSYHCIDPEKAIIATGMAAFSHAAGHTAHSTPPVLGVMGPAEVFAALTAIRNACGRFQFAWECGKTRSEADKAAKLAVSADARDNPAIRRGVEAALGELADVLYGVQSG